MTASTLNLANFEGRVSQLLDDSSNLLFAVLLVDGCIRQALGDISRATGTRLTIDDLDSATATTVDARDEDVLVGGAMGYAARTKALDRSQAMNLGQSMTANLLELSKNALDDYQDKLKQIKARTLQESPANIPGSWDWDESTRHW